MKRIIIISHQKSQELQMRTCENGDKYDSEIQVRDETGKILYAGICNVNGTNEGVEIENGEYKGIVGLHKNKYKAILIYKSNREIKSWKELKESERTLPTNEPNPAQKGQKIAKFINIHKGGDDWDWSEGCITIYWKDWANFISKFEDNEIMQIIKYKDYQEYQGALHI